MKTTKTAEIAKIYPDDPNCKLYGYAVRENGREIAHGGPVERDVAIHNCLTLGAPLPKIIPTDLSPAAILSALVANGSGVDGSIVTARFVEWTKDGAKYEIAVDVDADEDERMEVVVTERSGRLVADY